MGLSAVSLQAAIRTGFGPGVWRSSNASMSSRAAAYQTKITGRPANEAYVVKGVEFDGFRNGVLLEAKGPRYEYLLGQKFGAGVLDQLVVQAGRQQRAAGSARIEWHVAEAGVTQALRAAFTKAGIRIEVVHTPP